MYNFNHKSSTSGKALTYTQLLCIKTTIDQIQNSKSHYYTKKIYNQSCKELLNI
jgi:hypothetical protein